MNSEPRSDWFLTATGRRIFVTEPTVDDICVEDIALALSKICRFGGHCNPFYSVAQHSVWVSNRCPPTLAVHGLLHDATEAYLGDVVRPLKRQLSEYRQLEARWWGVIRARFGIADGDDAIVKAIDLRALMTERRDLTHFGGASPYGWVEDEARAEPDSAVIQPYGPDGAAHQFFAACQRLGVS